MLFRSEPEFQAVEMGSHARMHRTETDATGRRPMQGEPEFQAAETGSHVRTHRTETDATTYGQHLLRLPLSERPLCPFEQAEYNATVTDVMQRTMARPENSYGLHLAHQIALITVMVSRAARPPFLLRKKRWSQKKPNLIRADLRQ